MKAALLVMSVTLFCSACATVPWEKTPKQDVSWGGLRMKLPVSWVVVAKDDRLEAKNGDTGESVWITEFTPAPQSPASTRSPLQIIENTVANLSPPDPDEPEFYTIEPYRIFYLPCGEPAAVEVEGLGGNEFTIAYSIASNHVLYSVYFYRIGHPRRHLDYYQKIVESAYVPGYTGSKCTRDGS